MSHFAERIQDLHQSSNGFKRVQESLTPEIVLEACEAEQVHVGRFRKLPRISLVWLLVGIALYRNQSIQDVAKKLNLGLGVVPRSSSISEARARLGASPLRWLFQRLAGIWNEKLASQKICGRTVCAIDGTVVTLEDTKANVEFYGKPGSRKDKADAARPQARAVALMDVTTKMLLDAEVVPLCTGENTAVKPLIDRIPADTMVIVDRGFQSKTNFAMLAKPSINRHFIARVKSTLRPRWIRDVTPCSWIGELTYSASERANNPDLPETLLLRIVEYRVEGHRDVIRVATSDLEESSLPATEIAHLYGQRWEFELGLRDLKSTLLQSKTALRSKKPDGVRQEMFAIFLAYNMVRYEIGLVAHYHGVAPQRLSFKTSMNSVEHFFTIFASDYADLDTIPDAIVSMRQWMWRQRLPERNPQRSCPRWVKNKQPSKFPKKPSSPGGV